MAEQQTEFDAARYKNAQREQWNFATSPFYV